MLMPYFIYIQDETIRLQMNIIVHSISVNQILLKASLIFFSVCCQGCVEDQQIYGLGKFRNY